MKILDAVKYAAMALTFFTFGCGKLESNLNLNKTKEALIPDQLVLQVSQAQRALTTADVANIKETFAQRKKIEIPIDLLLADQEAKISANDRHNFLMKEQEFKYLASPESYEMYKALRANCSKNRVEGHSEMSFPLERVNSLNDLKVNDRIVSETTLDYTGSNCMLNAKTGFGYAVRVERMDPDAVVSMTFSNSLSALLSNQKYADLLNSKGFAVTSKVSMLAGKTDARSSNFENVKGLLTFELNGSYFTAKNEIPFSVKNSILSSTNQNKDIKVQMVQNYIIKMPDLDVTVDTELVTVQTGQENARVIGERYFVNGVEKTKAELEELFGSALRHKESINTVRAILD